MWNIYFGLKRKGLYERDDKMNSIWLKELPLSNIKKIKAVAGGDVNKAYRVITAEKNYFLLVQPNRKKDFYAAEIAGLNAFHKAGITAPVVIDSGEINGDAYLLLSYLDEGYSGSQFELGQLIAKLHMHYSPNKKYGFSLPYEGGEISFSNKWTDSWASLFIDNRLDKLAKAIYDRGYWHKLDLNKYSNVREVILYELSIHESQPSLLHGDLWAGNYMFLKNGRPALFDPAPLYGDREFDIGITQVFGGFSEEFYESYNIAYPLESGYLRRLAFYRLYFLMIHLNKFGNTYLSSVEREMDIILTKE